MSEIHNKGQIDRRWRVENPPGEERRRGRIRDLEVRVERKSKSEIVVHIANEFVADNSPLLDEALGRLFPLERGTLVELEMSGIPYADSDALSQILGWARKINQAGSRLVLANPTPYVAEILRTLHLDEILPIVRRRSFPAT